MMEVSNVRVAVRARPLSKREIDLQSQVCIGMNGRCTRLFKTVSGLAVGETRDDSKEFEYDHSYWSVDTSNDHFVSQEQVFKDLGTAVLESAFQGYNACVFAYGQTGSGKTYTMMGTEADPGLVPRICQNLFAKIAAGSRKQVSYEVKASFMEIYNEKVRDLLDLNSGKNAVHNLKIREHPKDGPYVENLSHHEVSDYGTVSKLMSIGNAHRATASTSMNDVSSRSHAIFSIMFTQAAFSSDVPCETVSRINLVDLAGSERASATGAEGIRLKEGGNINRSLACLGNVISALAEMSSRSNKQKKAFIPYRDSVLTWLLKDSLGGNSRTIMVATISPAEVSFGETLSTLRYASRAKNIVNKPVVNEDPNVRLIRELKAEIQRLKAIITASNLSDTEQGGAKALLSEDIHKKEEQIAELTRTWAGKWKDIQTVIEKQNLALHTEGIKMTLASEKPHLLTIDGTSASGVVLYYLQDGITHIGCETSMSHPEIALEVEGIKPKHCKLNFSSGTVSLIVEDGLCNVNSEEIDGTRDLNHGDIIQLGDKVTFRFNHLNSQKNQKGSQVPVSPLALKTLRDQLEKERKSMQESFDKRVALMQEEFEKRSNQEDAERFHQLRRDYSASISSVDDNNESIKELEPYARMQSVVHTPPTRTPMSSTPDLSKRIVIGEERHAVVHSPNQLTTDSSYRNLSEEDSDLQTGYIDISLVEGNLEMSYLDESLETKSLIEQVDAADTHEREIHSLGNLSQESFKNATTSLSSGTNADLQSEIKRAQSLLDQALKNEQAAKSRNQRLEASIKRRKEAYEGDKALLSEKVQRLEAEVRKMNVLDTGARRRSNAFGEKDGPKLRRHSSSRDIYIKKQILVEIPYSILRGNGFSSYYVYEVKVTFPKGDKLLLYKEYSQFRAMHDELLRRYPTLSTLKFPPAKWFGAKRPEFVDRRRQELQNYLQSLVSICVNLPECSLSTVKYYKLAKDDLCSFHSFFHVGDV